MELDVWTREEDKNTPLFDRTCIKVPQRRSPDIAVVGSNSGHVPTLNDDWTGYVLYQALWDDGKQPAYIGESGDTSVVGAGPPDPLITVKPVAGEEFTVTSKGIRFDATTGKATEQSMVAKYKTINTGGNWWADRFPDTCRTALEERPDTFGEGNWVYNYLWARDIGAISLWWGLRQKDNTWKGYEWLYVEHG